MIPENVV